MRQLGRVVVVDERIHQAVGNAPKELQHAGQPLDAVLLLEGAHDLYSRFHGDAMSKPATRQRGRRAIESVKVYLLFGLAPVAIIVVHGNGSQLDSEDHLRTAEVEGPAAPVGVHTVDVSAQQQRQNN